MSQQTEDLLQQFKDCIPLLEVLTDENRYYYAVSTEQTGIQC